MDDGRLGDRAPLPELLPVHRFGEGWAPRVIGAENGDAGGQEGVLWKRTRRGERQPQLRRLALHVTPHVPALGREEVERRRRPALRREERSEKERPPADRNSTPLGQSLDAH